MSHHNHHHHHSPKSTKNLRVAFFLNLSFTLIEIVGGFLTQSLAILSDALHDLGDSLSLALAWYFQHLSRRKSDNKFTYGYQRFSILGAIINSIVLIIGSFFIIREAIPRVSNPQETHPQGMIILAIFGVVINGIAVLRLKKGHSHNEKVVSLHLLEDVFGWLAVLIGGVIIYFTGWYQIDPILSLLISIFILINVFRNIKETFRIILQAVPGELDIEKIKKTLLAIPGIQSIHDLHVWTMDGEKNILTVHLVRDATNKVSDQEMKAAVHDAMHEMDIEHCTLEIENVDEECLSEDCNQAQVSLKKKEINLKS